MQSFVGAHGNAGNAAKKQFRLECKAHRKALEEAEQDAMSKMQAQCKPLLDKFDTDSSGRLSRGEFVRLVQEMGGSSLSPDAAERIVVYVMGASQAQLTAAAAMPVVEAAAMPVVEAAAMPVVEVTTMPVESAVALSDLPKALLLAHAFIAEEAAATDALFDRYDTDGSGALDFKEVVSLLRDALNSIPDKKRPQLSASAVMFILSRADVNRDLKVSKQELAPALAIWRTLLPSMPIAMTGECLLRQSLASRETLGA